MPWSPLKFRELFYRLLTFWIIWTFNTDTPGALMFVYWTQDSHILQFYWAGEGFFSVRGFDIFEVFFGRGFSAVADDVIYHL